MTLKDVFSYDILRAEYCKVRAFKHLFVYPCMYWGALIPYYPGYNEIGTLLHKKLEEIGIPLELNIFYLFI